MMMALLPLLMCRRPCHHQAGIVALVTMALLPLIRDGIVALVATALLPSPSWHCRSCCNGVTVIINAQAFLPSLQWCCCPCCDGIVAVDAQVSLPLSQLQLLPS